MELTHLELASLKTEITKDRKGNEIGFCLWVEEMDNDRLRKHWLIDGSCLKDDLTIRIGFPYGYNIKVKYYKDSTNGEYLKIVKSKK